MTLVIPLIHPSAIMQGQWSLGPAQAMFIAQGARIAKDGFYSPPDMEQAPQGAIIYPTLQDLEVFASKINSHCSVDIECAGDFLVCVGICHQSDESYVCIRFRSLAEIYQPEELEARTRWLFEFLADPNIKKVFHNGQAFDIPYLERQGFVVNGFANDTMLQAHVAFAEMPKKLNFLALAYLGIPNWKTLVSEKDEEKENQ